MHGGSDTARRTSKVSAARLALITLLAPLALVSGPASHGAPAPDAPAAEPATTLATGGLRSLASAPDGTIGAAWTVRDGDAYGMVVALRRPGGGWGRSRSIVTGVPFPNDAELAVGDDGAAVVVWSDSESGDVMAATRAAGGAWQPPQEISSDDTSASPLSVAMSADGVATVVWEQDYNYSAAIYAARHAPGSDWETPVRLNRDSGDAFDPSVAVGPAGDVVAVWWVWRGSEEFAVAASRPVGAPWEEETLISEGLQNVGAPDVVVDAEGRATAAWDADPGTGPSGAQFSVRERDGAWSRAEEIDPSSMRSPVLAVAPGGTKVVAAWTLIPGGVVVSRLARGSWTDPEVASRTNSDYVRAAVTRGGRTVVGYQRHVDGTTRATVAVRERGTWTEIVLGRQGEESTLPHLAPSGEAVAVAWSESDPARVATADVVARPRLSRPALRSDAIFTPRSGRRPNSTSLRVRVSAPGTMRVSVRPRGARLKVVRTAREVVAGSERFRLRARSQGRTLQPGRYVVTVRAANAAGSAERRTTLTVRR